MTPNQGFITNINLQADSSHLTRVIRFVED